MELLPSFDIINVVENRAHVVGLIKGNEVKITNEILFLGNTTTSPKVTQPEI
jgi:hypothetical protein